MVSGFLSSIAGLIMMARANSAKAEYGAPYMLQCVLIAVLGGVDPNGGFGKIAGVTMAIFILQFLSSGLNMFNSVSNFYRDVIWGGVLSWSWCSTTSSPAELTGGRSARPPDPAPGLRGRAPGSTRRGSLSLSPVPGSPSGNSAI